MHSFYLLTFFTCKFFIQNWFAQFFSIYILALYFFGKKITRKMLVKLTPDLVHRIQRPARDRRPWYWCRRMHHRRKQCSSHDLSEKLSDTLLHMFETCDVTSTVWQLCSSRFLWRNLSKSVIKQVFNTRKNIYKVKLQHFYLAQIFKELLTFKSKQVQLISNKLSFLRIIRILAFLKIEGKFFIFYNDFIIFIFKLIY